MDTKTIAIHNGKFHADDLFATETMLRFYELQGISRENVQIIRTRSDELIEGADAVLDVGGIYDPSIFRFDHHQEGGAGERENGIPYAAFGLVWKAFGKEIAGSGRAAETVEKHFVETIDALDNGVDIFGDTDVNISHRYLLQNVFRSLHPTWNEKEYTVDDAFAKALKLAHVILKREITYAQSEEEGSNKSFDAYEQTGAELPELLILDDQYPYSRVVDAHPEICFVVQPSKEEGSWKARAVWSGKKSFAARKLFPEAWAGKRDGELAAITGVEDAVFVHNKRFIAVARSKEGILSLARKALEG